MLRKCPQKRYAIKSTTRSVIKQGEKGKEDISSGQESHCRDRMENDADKERRERRGGAQSVKRPLEKVPGKGQQDKHNEKKKGVARGGNSEKELERCGSTV